MEGAAILLRIIGIPGTEAQELGERTSKEDEGAHPDDQHDNPHFWAGSQKAEEQQIEEASSGPRASNRHPLSAPVLDIDTSGSSFPAHSGVMTG
jgi:hypothetical protein